MNQIHDATRRDATQKMSVPIIMLCGMRKNCANRRKCRVVVVGGGGGGGATSLFGTIDSVAILNRSIISANTTTQYQMWSFDDTFTPNLMLPKIEESNAGNTLVAIALFLLFSQGYCRYISCTQQLSYLYRFAHSRIRYCRRDICTLRYMLLQKGEAQRNEMQRRLLLVRPAESTLLKAQHSSDPSADQILNLNFEVGG
jgi:hypothetical protein